MEHSKLDLDTLAMETNADLQTEEGFTAAYEAYSLGGNSMYGEDGFRTIQAFSTDAEEKLGGEKRFEVYQNYWGAPDYADRFTSAACTGTGGYETVEPVVRAEACTKGAQYQNVWMYVIHEMENAVGACKRGDYGAADGGPHHWDEAWAFYAGSLEGESGNADGDGKMLYALAQKRCGNFGTCGGADGVTGTAAINDDVLELIAAGSGYLLEGECAEAEDAKERIVQLMTVPLLQGTLRYLYRADPASDYDGDAKHWAELWAFAAAILPLIDECSADVAHTVRSNSDIASEHAPVSAGFVTVKEELESIYSCLGMTCDQVGGLLAGDSTTDYVPGLEPCGREEEPTEPANSGCYRDSRDDRRLAMGPMSSRDMTPTLCNEYCVGQYASFYAVQYGRECWCGDDSTDYAKLGALDMTECAYPCTGDADLTCGGFDSFEIFSLPAEKSRGFLGSTLTSRTTASSGPARSASTKTASRPARPPAAAPRASACNTDASAGAPWKTRTTLSTAPLPTAITPVGATKTTLAADSTP
ncbi:unnamed protein product [Ectocarpus sp. 12 AP-2014]